MQPNSIKRNDVYWENNNIFLYTRLANIYAYGGGDKWPRLVLMTSDTFFCTRFTVFLQKTNQQSLCFMREQRGENMCLFGVLMHFISITSLRAAQLPNTKLAHGQKAVLFVGNHTNMVKTFWSITATNQPPPPVPISFDK